MGRDEDTNDKWRTCRGGKTKTHKRSIFKEAERAAKKQKYEEQKAQATLAQGLTTKEDIQNKSSTESTSHFDSSTTLVGGAEIGTRSQASNSLA